jgi:hypothetical protein
MADPLYDRYIASLRVKARENPNGLPPVVWMCPTCNLGSFQKREDAFLRHLEQIHADELDEKRHDPNIDFEEWREDLKRKAFATPKR